MTNKTRFCVCRGCLMSFAVADLIDLFEESGENLKKIQEISRIDISKDENNNYALICRGCLVKVATGFEIARTLRNTEKHYFSKLRGKTGGEIEASEEEETRIHSENAELEENETLTSILDVLNEDLDKYLEEAYEDLVQGAVTDIIVGVGHQVQNQKSYEESSSSDGELSLLEVDSREEELQAAVEDNDENEAENASQDELEGESAAVMESENSSEDSIEVSEKKATQEESSTMFADARIKANMLVPKKIGENTTSNEEAQNFDDATLETEHLETFAEKVNSSGESKRLKKISEKKSERIQSKIKIQEKSQKQDGENGSYRRKMKIVEGKKVIKCSVCLMEFFSNSSFKIHMASHTFANDNTSNQNRPFKCSFEGCEMFFKSKGNLNRHETSHNPENIKCSICSKDYASKDSLRFHVKHSHIKKTIFKCDCCPKIFNRKRNFLSHFRSIHINKKPSNFPKPSVMTSNHCKICFRLCSNRGSLKVHIEMIHEKKRNFTCDLCSKMFYFKGNLRDHMPTHIFVKDDTTNSDHIVVTLTAAENSSKQNGHFTVTKNSFIKNSLKSAIMMIKIVSSFL